ncbi:MAG: type II toxin-antitoxin system HicA family toxin [Candidatus Latescibacterota bacterium]
MHLSRRHRRTLEAICARPTRADVRWADIESLFRAVGAEVTEGSGSRVRIRLGDQVKTFHRPHPGREARRYAQEAVRAFLADHGFTPESM